MPDRPRAASLTVERRDHPVREPDRDLNVEITAVREEARSREHVLRLVRHEPQAEPEQVRELPVEVAAAGVGAGPRVRLGLDGEPGDVDDAVPRPAREDGGERARLVGGHRGDAPDPAGLQHLLGPDREAPVVPAVGDGRGAARRPCGGRDRLRVGQLHGHRLLDEHVDAGLERRDRVLAVESVRRGDDDAVDACGKQLVDRGRRDLEPELALEGIEAVLGLPDDPDELDVRMLAVDRQVVIGGPEPGSDHADAGGHERVSARPRDGCANGAVSSRSRCAPRAVQP